MHAMSLLGLHDPFCCIHSQCFSVGWTTTKNCPLNPHPIRFLGPMPMWVSLSQ